MKPDPAKSFWKDEMVSPFPVKYAKVKDRRGVEWEIGYFDEYCGKDKNPPVLVVVHGKGAFAAHYGYLIKYAVERGYRVIAPDMPQWGMSGPGNLDKPMTRTLDDVRDAFHALIVGKLGVKKAFYHGHSLGGATVLGYALRYPDAVRGLILEGPAGLEEYPRNIKLGDKETAAVRQVLRLRPQALGGGLRSDRHARRRRQAHRAGRARLLLLQAARSEDRTPSRPATTATSRSTPSTRGCTRTSASR